MKTVYVVTDSELGWDCVVAVYDNESAAEAYAEWCGDMAHVSDMTIEDTFNIEDYE